MRSTPSLLVVFIVVLQRWLDLRTGWPESVVFPLVGIAGSLLIDRLLLPPAARLDARGWAINVGLALAVGVVLFVLGG